MHSTCIIFISTQFVVLILVPCFGELSKKILLFDIPSSYSCINLRSSNIYCLFSKDVFLSLGIFLPCSFVTVYRLFCDRFSGNFVILLTILLQLKSPVASAVFLITFFELVLSKSVADCLVWWRRSCWCFYQNFYPCFYQKIKIH